MSNDKSSPASLAKRVSSDKAREERHLRELEAVRKEGFHEGQRRGHQDLLDFLQEAYLGADRPDRGSAKANAILEVARDASNHFKGLEDRSQVKRRRS